MFRNIFKSILFVTFIFCCFSNLHAIIETEQKIQTSDDRFIRTFVQRTGSNKVNYDGKNLILYADPGVNTNTYFSLSFAICTIFGLACLSCDDKEVKVGGGLLALFCDILCVIGLLGNLYYENNNIPFITITNEGIKVWDNRKISWNQISRLKYEKIKIIKDGIPSSNKYVVNLCDEYLNSILKIDDDKYLPITFDNLITILEHYIEKTKHKINP